MAISDQTPQVSKGFKDLQVTLFRHAPKRLREVVLAGKQIRAMTSTGRRRA